MRRICAVFGVVLDRQTLFSTVHATRFVVPSPRFRLFTRPGIASSPSLSKHSAFSEMAPKSKSSKMKEENGKEKVVRESRNVKRTSYKDLSGSEESRKSEDSESDSSMYGKSKKRGTARSPRKKPAARSKKVSVSESDDSEGMSIEDDSSDDGKRRSRKPARSLRTKKGPSYKDLSDSEDESGEDNLSKDDSGESEEEMPKRSKKTASKPKEEVSDKEGTDVENGDSNANNDSKASENAVREDGKEQLTEDKTKSVPKKPEHDISDEDKSEEEVVPAKKRGRPSTKGAAKSVEIKPAPKKQEHNMSDEDEESEEEVLPTKKRGRPPAKKDKSMETKPISKKPEHDMSDEDEESVEEVLPTKKRGRPPTKKDKSMESKPISKKPEHDMSDEDEEEKSEEEVLPTKKRGRPPIKKDESIESKPVSTKPEHDISDEDEEKSEEEVPPTKKRGRPPSKKDESMETKPVSNEPEDDVSNKSESEEEAVSGQKRGHGKNSEKEKPPAKKAKVEAPAKMNKTDTDFESIDFGSEAKTADGKLWNFKISSWNVAGLKALIKKNGFEFLKYEQPDILCLQETKCSEKKLPPEAKVQGYHAYWLTGEKEGYAGVGLLSKEKPLNVSYGLDNKDFDNDGRVITAEYEKFFLVNVYVPNAGQGLKSLPRRMEWDPMFRAHLKKLDETKPVILCGDLNVAHNEIDLTNPKTNVKTAGFTPQEREGMTTLLKEGFVDTFRHLYPDKTGAYSFWAYFNNSRSRNIGWRIDYFIFSERLVPSLCDNVMRTEVMGSDHCPVTLFVHF